VNDELCETSLLIPHLIFAHLLADYVLQTNWLVARKSQSWDGLALHGLMVFVMSLMVLSRYASVLLIPLLIMSVLHTIQDWGKVYSGPRIKIAPFYPYILDQVLHYTTILILQLLIGPQLQPPPSNAEIIVMSIGAVSIAVTRFYDVTWWANWLDMIPYMNRWRNWGYLERLGMVVLTAGGLFFLAPLCPLPRLIYGWQHHHPVWKQRRGSLEVITGIILSITLGLAVRALVLV